MISIRVSTLVTAVVVGLTCLLGGFLWGQQYEQDQLPDCEEDEVLVADQGKYPYNETSDLVCLHIDSAVRNL